jgi:hypothetical protein
LKSGYFAPSPGGATIRTHKFFWTKALIFSVILKESSGQGALQATIQDAWLPVWLSNQKILPE